MNADIQRAFAEQLRAAGLIVEHVETDGCLHRCGTEGRPNRRDGAHKAFSDVPASLWWKNWRTGDEGAWTCKPEKELIAAERDVLRERIRVTRAYNDAEQAHRWQAAGKLAASTGIRPCLLMPGILICKGNKSRPSGCAGQKTGG